MKITGNSDLSELLSSKAALNNTWLASEAAYLHKATLLKPPRRREARKLSSPGTGRLRLKTSAGKRSRPQTPLHQWTLDDGKKSVASSDGKLPPEVGRRSRRAGGGVEEPVVSARKLAAGLWLREGEMHRRQSNNDDDTLGFRRIGENRFWRLWRGGPWCLRCRFRVIGSTVWNLLVIMGLWMLLLINQCHYNKNKNLIHRSRLMWIRPMTTIELMEGACWGTLILMIRVLRFS